MERKSQQRSQALVALMECRSQQREKGREADERQE